MRMCTLLLLLSSSVDVAAVVVVDVASNSVWTLGHFCKNVPLIPRPTHLNPSAVWPIEPHTLLSLAAFAYEFVANAFGFNDALPVACCLPRRRYVIR